MKSLISVLWNSPTFTSWGNYAVQMLRLILVTPLLLTRFDTVEIAAWYLFVSFNVFGTIITTRIGLTYSRMFAFAMGGSDDLSPIKGPREVKSEPNWSAFSRAYGTLGYILLLVGSLNLFIAILLGWYGLGNLTDGYDGSAMIWATFLFFQFSQFSLFIFRRYGFALVGMNYVSMQQRWDMIFGLISVAVGAGVLMFGGGIFALAFFMQIFAILGPLRMRFLLNRVEKGRVLKMSPWKWDRTAFKWSWEPTWKGFIGEFSASGSAQVIAVLYVGMVSKSEAATFLFATRILDVIVNMGQVPYTSIQPKLSRLMASNQLGELRRLLRLRFAVSFSLTAVGILASTIVFTFGFDLIGSNITFMEAPFWLFFGAMSLVVRFIILNASVMALGNNFPYYTHSLVMIVASFLIVSVMGDHFKVLGPIIAITLPAIVILNINPVVRAKEILKMSDFYEPVRDFAFVLFVFTAIACLGLYV